MSKRGTYGEPIQENGLQYWILIHGDRAVKCVNALDGYNPDVVRELIEQVRGYRRALARWCGLLNNGTVSDPFVEMYVRNGCVEDGERVIRKYNCMMDELAKLEGRKEC